MGAYFADDNESDSGAAYVYHVGPPDADDNGIPDDPDECRGPGTGTTILIGGGDSAVGSHVLDDGCTIADRIGDGATGAENDSGFVGCVAHLTNGWKRDELITGAEKGAI